MWWVYAHSNATVRVVRLQSWAHAPNPVQYGWCLRIWSGRAFHLGLELEVVLDPHFQNWPKSGSLLSENRGHSWHSLLVRVIISILRHFVDTKFSSARPGSTDRTRAYCSHHHSVCVWSHLVELPGGGGQLNLNKI